MHIKATLPVWKLCLVAILVSGCSSALTQRGSQLLVDGGEAVEARKYAEAITHMDEFLRDNPRSEHVARACYLRGKAYYGLKNVPLAEADLTEAAQDGSGPVKVNAHLALADIAWDAGNLVKAEQMYSAVADEVPAGDVPGDHAYYRLGCVQQRLGKWSEADVRFYKVVEHYPGSELAKRAGRRVNATAWTIQTGAFRTKARGDAHVKQMRTKKVMAELVAVLIGDRPMFLSVAGRYTKYEQALTAFDRVKRVQGDAYVTVR